MTLPANKNLLLWAAFGLLLSLLVWFFTTYYEVVTETVEIGLQGEAKRNPLLALQRLLERLDVPVESRYGLPAENLPMQPGDTLVLWQEEGSVSFLLAPAILQWVEMGGRLVLTTLHADDLPSAEAQAENAEAEPIVSDDPLFSTLGMNLFEIPDSHDQQDSVAVYWQGDTFNANLSTGYVLQHPSANNALEVWSADQSRLLGGHLLHFNYGQGYVTAFSDLWFISNDNIGAQDHADLFWRVLNSPAPLQKVWLFAPQGNVVPSLLEWLWQAAWPFLISLLVLLLFVLWSISRRFGPIVPPPTTARRRILEHLEASGRFLWQNGQGAYLHSAVVRALWERLEVVHPDWLHLSATELSQHLAELSDLPTAQVHQALQVPHTAQDFLSQIQTLATIRKAL